MSERVKPLGSDFNFSSKRVRTLGREVETEKDKDYNNCGFRLTGDNPEQSLSGGSWPAFSKNCHFSIRLARAKEEM